MNKYVKRYFVDALAGMALGLFSTLIIGLIIKQIGSLFPAAENGGGLLAAAGVFLVRIGQLITVLTGAGIAAGVAHALGAPKLALYASILTGLAGAHATGFLAGSIISESGSIVLSGPGDPLGALAAALCGAEAGRLVSGKTKIDIIVTPAVTILCGCIAAVVFGPPLAAASGIVGGWIRLATELQPFWMGIVLSAAVGMLLTLPVSSAAVAIILGLSGLAGGAATAGCCAQMIGFAVISWKDNGLNGLLAQGLGTSMLQVPNIIKNPRIWIPPTAASVITGPLATIVFKMKNLPAGAGMGTSGLVGPLLSWQAMSGGFAEHVSERAADVSVFAASPAGLAASMIFLYALLPAAISFAVYVFMRKKGWIQDGDMKLAV
ncbi:MAG: PTS sugar transporter subunit IIC [Bacteroides sp.]|nr:PTS sugar transporter subunit IIC [Prevotella sp.]MCM1407200.1 PTS sugar transporter subunit IIC [Treponema brennaborense]MCM1470352.1 PTS sugar transporter subunit IIC [Bacteroides sp.]